MAEYRHPHEWVGTRAVRVPWVSLRDHAGGVVAGGGVSHPLPDAEIPLTPTYSIQQECMEQWPSADWTQCVGFPAPPCNPCPGTLIVDDAPPFCAPPPATYPPADTPKRDPLSPLRGLACQQEEGTDWDFRSWGGWLQEIILIKSSRPCGGGAEVQY